MENFEVRAKTDKADKRKFVLYSFFGRSKASAVTMVIFPLIAIVYPTVGIIIGATDLHFSPIAILYVISAWTWITLTCKEIASEYGGVTEYGFSADGLRIKNEVCENLFPADKLKSCEETASLFVIFADGSSVYVVPKHYITAENGEKIRTFFGNKLIKKGKADNSAFKGDSCESLDLKTEESTAELTLTMTEEYKRKAALIRAVSPFQLSKIAFMVMLTLLIIYSGTGNLPLGIVISAVFVGFMYFVSVKAFETAAKAEAEACGGEVKAVFHDSYIELIFGSRTNRLPLGEIKKVSTRGHAAEIKTAHGSFVIPASEELSDKLKN